LVILSLRIFLTIEYRLFMGTRSRVGILYAIHGVNLAEFQIVPPTIHYLDWSLYLTVRRHAWALTLPTHFFFDNPFLTHWSLLTVDCPYYLVRRTFNEWISYDYTMPALIHIMSYIYIYSQQLTAVINIIHSGF